MARRSRAKTPSWHRPISRVRRRRARPSPRLGVFELRVSIGVLGSPRGSCDWPDNCGPACATTGRPASGSAKRHNAAAICIGCGLTSAAATQGRPGSHSRSARPMPAAGQGDAPRCSCGRLRPLTAEIRSSAGYPQEHYAGVSGEVRQTCRGIGVLQIHHRRRDSYMPKASVSFIVINYSDD